MMIGTDDDEFANTPRLALSLKSSLARLGSIRLRTETLYLTPTIDDSSAMQVHPFNLAVIEAGGIADRSTQRKLNHRARKTPPASLALRAEHTSMYTLTLRLAAHRQRQIAGGTRETDNAEKWRETVETAGPKLTVAGTTAQA
eukprot:jgi/Tetstr1/421104/TSEL_012148.t1